jgi:hypothetical protein
MKTKISTYVQLFLNSVELNIAVTEDLKGERSNLMNFGWFEISDGTISGETCSWDNLQFFYNLSLKDFKRECGEDLERCEFGAKKIWKDINKLLKRAIKLKLLNFD